MDLSLIQGYQGMRALMERIDTIANNVANVDTTGFKARETTFGEILYQQLPNQPGGEQANADGRITPEQIRIGSGIITTGTPIRFTQGTRKETGIETDLMIEGEGFFRVRKDENQNGNLNDDPIYYTRAGRFTRSPGADGNDYLVTPTGEFLLDEFDNPVAIAAGNRFRVERDGTLVQIDPDGREEPNYERIAVYSIPNLQEMGHLGNNLWAYPVQQQAGQAPPPAGQAPLLMNDAPERFAIHQGALEASNVDLTKEMTSLIETERHLQLTSRSLQMTDQMLGLANEMVRR
ncbi:MAG: flagellar hook-basal body protein [Thermicanus sp.]|nr:flagellar hook-basal body protein [Thermicanus sp.]